MRRQLRKFVRNLKKIRRSLEAKSLRLEELGVREVLKLGLKLAHTQIKIRPRARLASKFIIAAILLLAVLGPAASYLEARRADIEIGGHKILVAQPLDKEVETIDIDQEISAQKSPFEFYKPVLGNISQGFSRYHRAMDIAAPYGTQVRPIGNGTVAFAGKVYDGHGNMVIIDHGNGLKSSYAHLGKIYVGAGNDIDAKTAIGTVGLTGRTTGAHVHMEITDNDTYVDPAGILPR